MRSPPPGQTASLTFTGFDLDDFDDGVGQLQVLVNGQLVADIPAGLNHLSGSGDFAAYADTAVNFGPFDVSSLLVNGQNSVSFTDPLSEHSGMVRNVAVVQGDTPLLHVHGARAVFPGHSVTFTFSIPPLVLTSFSVSTTTPVEGQVVTFTATFTGGTTPSKCIFGFGDGEHSVVAGVSGTCSAVHDYDGSGIFKVFVIVTSSSTSDRVTGSISLTVAED